MKAYRVLLVTKSFQRGGAATGVNNLYKALVAAGHTVYRIDAEKCQGLRSRIARIFERGVEHLFFGSNIHCLRFGDAMVDVAKIVEELNVDLVQLGDVSGNVIDFADLDNCPCPVVHRLSDHWPYSGAQHYITHPDTIRSVLANAALKRIVFDGHSVPNLLVAPSEWLFRSVVTSIPKIFIRNAVAPAGFDAARGEAQYPARIGFVAHPYNDPRKGFAQLVPLLDLLAKKRVFKFYVYGGRSGRFPQISLPVALNEITEFRGRFSREEASDVYSEMDLLLCPSLLDNSPNTLCEALSFGVPVIGRSGTGMESYLSAKTGGLCDFSLADFSSFELLFDRILNSYKIYSGNAVSFAEQQMSFRNVGRAYSEAYDSVICSGENELMCVGG